MYVSRLAFLEAVCRANSMVNLKPDLIFAREETHSLKKSGTYIPGIKHFQTSRRCFFSHLYLSYLSIRCWSVE